MNIRGRLLISLFVLTCIFFSASLIFRNLIRESEYQILQFSKGALIEVTYASLMSDALNDSQKAAQELLHEALGYEYARIPGEKDHLLEDILRTESLMNNALTRFKEALASAQGANQAQQDMAREFRKIETEKSEILETEFWLGQLDREIREYENLLKQLCGLSRTSYKAAAALLENDIDPLAREKMQRFIDAFRKDSREEAEQQVETILENFHLKKVISYGAGSISIVLAILLSIYLSRTIFAPLTDLAAAIKDMTGHRFIPPPTVNPRDEIGRLAQVISDMDQAIKERTQELQQAQGELADQNLRLEKRVAEQTRQLTEKNSSLSREIQDRIHAERRLRKSEERFRLAMEASREGIWDWNVKTGQVYFSPGCAAMLGYGKDELTPGIQSWTDRIHPGDKGYAVKASKDCIENRVKDFSMEFRLKHKSGTWIWILGRGKAIERDDQGLALRIIGTHTDITPLKQAELEKIQSQKIFEEQRKLALIGRIAGKMAHDFNNTLGVIMGNAELGLMDCRDDRLSDFFNRILDHTMRGKNLTKNLVAFAKDIEPRQEYFNLGNKVDQVLGLLKKELEGIELLREDEPDIPELLADPGMIEHALINLIQNAIHALAKTKNPRITIKIGSRDNTIVLEVLDNGCGIPPEYMDRVYEPAFTLKGSRDASRAYPPGTKGTGYGLSNVKKYIDLHGGDIFFDSSRESGTRFSICLPIMQRQLSSREKEDIRESSANGGKNILLVEDEPAISEIQEKILSKDPCNHLVDVADSGKAAIALFDQEDKTYDLVSLDFILQDGIDGLDVYHHIRKKNQTLPILFISGNIEFLESINALKKKDIFLDHLSKPCNNLDYIKSVNRLMEESGQG